TGSLRARALGEHGMVLCAAAEYLRQQPAPQTIAGLNEHRTLGYLHNGQLQKWQLYDPQQGDVRFSPQTWLIQDDFAAIAAAVQQGMGIAWLPDWLVAQALADGTLQQVLAPSAQVRFAIHAVWPEGPWLPQKTRAAIDALREGLPLTATPG
ncbi:TPA: LysR family transcriptional regulator, partial [Klebsiella pneumoniae]|nr:LysR family transcriptional regulator [Klebsiella pneumoniae]